MKRKALKTISNKELDFIPEGYEEFDPKAKDIYERPLIFVGKRLTRDQYFEFQELTKAEYPKGMDVSKLTKEERIEHVMVKGKKDAFRYVWDNCVTKLKNVIIEVKGKVEKMDECADKELIWDGAEGLNAEIMQALAFFIDESSFSEADSKNSK